MNLPKELGKTSLKKRHLGVASLAVLISQYILGLQGEHKTKLIIEAALAKPIERVNVKVTDSILVREREFARKEDVNRVADKVDRLDNKMSEMKAEVAKLEGYLKSQEEKKHNDFWSFRENPNRRHLKTVTF